MQVCVCRLQGHQLCFLMCNVLLFHALLFGADLVEEFLLQSSPPPAPPALQPDPSETRLDNASSSQLYPINAGGAACRPPADDDEDDQLLILTLVLSAPGDAGQREALRASWANQTRVGGGARVRTLFFLGSARSGAEERALLGEAGLHGDVVQCGAAAGGGWQRARLALRWALAFCPRACFLLLARDSVFVNLPALAKHLLSRASPTADPDRDLYLGRVVRGAATPHDLPAALYPHRLLPDYVSGHALLLSRGAVRKVFDASAGVSAGLPLPTDVLIGLAARRAGVAPTHSARFSGGRHVRYNACCYNFLFSSAGMGAGQLGVAWRDLGEGKGRSCSLLKTYYSLVICKTLTYLDTLLNNNNTTQG